MRLVAALAAVILAAPLAARADDPPPPAPPAPAAKPDAKAARVPLRVVRVMPESNQALLFDRLRNTHVLAEVGGTVSGYQVEDITEDEVTLSIFGRQVVLAAPLRSHRTGEGRRNRVRTASAHGDAAAPVDPYADDVRDARAPNDATSDASPDPANDAANDPANDDANDAAPGSSKAIATRSRASSGEPSDPYEEPVRAAEAPDAANRAAPRVVQAPDSPTASAPRVVEAPDSPTASAPRAVEAPASTTATPPRSPAPDASKASAPRVVQAPDSPTASAPRVVEAPDATNRAAAANPAAPRAAEAPAGKRPAKGHKRTKSTAKQGSEATDDRAIAELFADAATATPHAPATAAPATTATTPATPATAATTTPTATTATTPAMAATTTTGATTAKAPAARPGQINLSRREVDRALGDFGRLAEAIHGSFTPAGVKVDGVAEGSVFERVGLRAGDTIAQVNGIVPRTLDDAANIYALASSAKTMTVLIVRDGKQNALRVAIQ